MRWPKYWSFSFSIIPSKEHAGLISFRMDWLDLLAQGKPNFIGLVGRVFQLLWEKDFQELGHYHFLTFMMGLGAVKVPVGVSHSLCMCVHVTVIVY